LLWNICVTNDHGYVPLVVNTTRSFPHSWLITGSTTRLTRRVSLVEEELITLPEHLSSPPVCSGVRVSRSLVLCACFVERCLSFCIFFFLVIVLSVLLRYTDSDYLFGIFKLFLINNKWGACWLYPITCFSHRLYYLPSIQCFGTDLVY
jgi:hypothetical protein